MIKFWNQNYPWRKYNKFWINKCYAREKRKNIEWIKMEHSKISKLLNDSTVSKFLTRKWIEVNDLLSDQYSVDKNTRFNTPML